MEQASRSLNHFSALAHCCCRVLSSRSDEFVVSFQIYGTVDLEQPAPQCGSTLLVVHMPITDVEDHLLEIPVHSKYPGAKLFTKDLSLSIFLGGYTTVEVPRGVIVLKTHNDTVVVLNLELGNQSWVLPAGSMGNYLFVSVGTGVTVLFSGLFLAWKLLTTDLNRLQMLN